MWPIRRTEAIMISIHGTYNVVLNTYVCEIYPLFSFYFFLPLCRHCSPTILYYIHCIFRHPFEYYETKIVKVLVLTIIPPCYTHRIIPGMLYVYNIIYPENVSYFIGFVQLFLWVCNMWDNFRLNFILAKMCILGLRLVKIIT